MEQQNNEKWGSRWGFLLATAGSAIGLGNIWKFPYITGVNGGAAFVFVYLLAILVVGMPLMIAELSLGRASGCHPAWAFDRFTNGRNTPVINTIGTLMILCGLPLAVSSYPGYAILLMVLGIALVLKGWKAIGVLTGVIAPFVIVCYYGVIGGWTIVYAVKAFSGGLNFADTAASGKAFGEMAVNGWISSLGMIIFMAMCAFVCYFG